MKEAVNITTGRADDPPLRLAHMQRMGLAAALLMPAEHVAQAVAAARAAGQLLQVVEREEADGSGECIPEGDEPAVPRSAEIDRQPLTWPEQRAPLPRCGTPRLTERAEIDQAIAQVLAQERVESLLNVKMRDLVTEQPVWVSGSRPAGRRLVRQFILSCQVNARALERARAGLGWRVSASTRAAAYLSLSQTVGASRDDSLVERTFGRVQGHPLPLAPVDVERDDHIAGVVRVFAIALQVRTHLGGVARRRLAASGSVLAGLCAGNPRRANAERLVEALKEVTLTVVDNPSLLLRQLTPLSVLQQCIFALLDFTPGLSTTLCGDSSEPPEVCANRESSSYFSRYRCSSHCYRKEDETGKSR